MPFCICDHRFFCKWKLAVLLPEGIGAELCTNHDFGSRKKNPKSSFFPFNHWEGEAVVRVGMTNVLQACFSFVKSEGTEIIYWECEDKDSFPHKKNGGESSSPWVQPHHWLDQCCWKLLSRKCLTEKLLHVWSFFFSSIFIAAYFSWMETWHSHFLNEIQFVLLLFRLVLH